MFVNREETRKQEKLDDTRPQLEHSLFMHLVEEREISVRMRAATELCNHGPTKPELCTFFRNVQQLLYLVHDGEHYSKRTFFFSDKAWFYQNRHKATLKHRKCTS